MVAVLKKMSVVVLLLIASAGVNANTIAVNGDVWLQPAELSGLSYADISAVCDEITGSCNGFLGGYNLAGWEWASPDDLNELLNYYINSAIGIDPLGPGEDSFVTTGADAGSISSAFFDDFFPTFVTNTPSFSTTGFMAGVSGVAGSVNFLDDIGAQIVVVDTGAWGFSRPDTSSGWFKQGEMPLPGTIPLLAIALIVLRRNWSPHA